MFCGASRDTFHASNTARIQRDRHPPSNVNTKSVNNYQNRGKQPVTVNTACTETVITVQTSSDSQLNQTRWFGSFKKKSLQAGINFISQR